VDVRGGKIVAIYPHETYRDAKFRASERLYDLGEAYHLMPGLIDVHTHISALGRQWEGYTSATQAAAAGGITTLMGMPLNSLPPTVNRDALHMEQQAARDADMFVDVGLWGGILPESMDDLPALLQSPCIFGIKAFLAPLPPSAGYASITPAQLRHVAQQCGDCQLPILVHAELMTTEMQDEQTKVAYAHGPANSYETHVQSRPAAWEQDAVRVVCEIVQDDLCDMHVVHLSDAGCLDMIHKTKQQQTTKRLTVETCPHYLLFAMEELPADSTLYKCFPPIRQDRNRQALWQKGIQSGLIDMVASDHSPCTPEMRQGSLQEAWGGLTGLQYQLPATWTAARSRGFSVADIVRWWSRAPASLVPSLAARKGSLLPGYQADLVWWDPAHSGPPSEWSKEYHRWTGDCVFSDMTLDGRVLGTWVRGAHVYNGWDDEHLTAPGALMQR
jgi:allantoinase